MSFLTKRTLSLRHLLIILTAIGLLPMALLGVWSIHAASQYQLREQERSMLDLARALSSAADAELDASVAMLASAARAPTLMAGDIDGFYDVAFGLAEAQAEWQALILTDDKGNVLFNTAARRGAAPPRVVDTESLKRVLATRQPVVGHILRGSRGRAAFPVRIPVIDDDGALYTLTAVIRPDRIVQMIQRQSMPEGSVISIIDAAGKIVARSRNHEGAVAGAPSASLMQLIGSAKSENVGTATTLEGDEVVSAYTTLSHYGWTVVVGQPAEQLRTAAYQRLAVYGAGILISLGVCIGIASLLSARIVTTIKGLQTGAAALGTGAPVTVVPSRIAEFQLIGAALEEAERQRAAQERERALLLDSLQRAMENQEAALTRAREAGRAKDEFLAVLGHELRNPLSPIVTSLDLMDMRDEPGARRERAVMRRQTNHLRRLVDDLLDVSRITSGKLRIDARQVNFADVVRHAVAASPQPVTLSAPPALWVRGDDSRLTQVLNNLLSNAVRFGSDDTRVSLAADGGQARLVVSDNGIGMGRDLLARVFEPFMQAPQTLERRTGGLGLGLAIVRKLVELHGGAVTADSDGTGRGSRFEVVLPLSEAAADAPQDAPRGASAGVRVLLVDDNVDAATSGAALLEQLGHEVRVLHSAEAALAQFRQYAPAVAILDIGLPDMDGYALAAALRRAQGGAPLKLVALTGYGQKEDVERAAAAGFDLHLTKPASAEELERAASVTG
ncbi:ATP-binding protein [Oxalobacteraceae bacterium OTU3CINTB1]|nr:ATP-binding protein [Oxalobacteraceae bacterium OTU3CINTB1]